MRMFKWWLVAELYICAALASAAGRQGIAILDRPALEPPRVRPRVLVQGGPAHGQTRRQALRDLVIP